MLETIRSRSSGIFAWAIAILIIMAMALFGVNSYVGHGGVDPALYSEGDVSVTLSQYQQALQQAQQRAISQNQEIDISSDVFKRIVLEQLIGQSMIQSMAESGGYVAADESVAKLIVQNSAFQVNGVFDQSAYDQFVVGSYGTKERYETLLKQNLVTSQVASGITESGLSLPSRQKQLLELATEVRNIELVRLNINEVTEGVELTEDQVSSYYEENKNNYLEPEKVSVEYITLAASGFEEGIEIDDEELQAIYETNIDSYTSEETRNIRHILFSGADAEDKANKVLAELNAGASFTELAEQSEDIGSGANGGDLGEVSKGQMVEAFEDAAFALPLNQVSEPVSTEFGYHLIEVTAINGGEARSFEEVKDELRENEIANRAEDIFFEKAETLRNATFENQDTLQVAADELGLFVEKSDFFSRDEGSGYFNNPSIRSTAFSDDVFNQNKNSDVIEVTPTEFVVIRKADYIAETPQPLEQVREEIEFILKSETASIEIKEKFDSVYEEVLASDDWQQVIESQELTSEVVSVSYLNSSDLPSEVIAEIFSTTDQGDFDHRIGVSYDASGSGFLYKLNNVEQAETDSEDVQIADSIKNVLANRNSIAVSQKYMRARIQEALNEVDPSLL